MNKLLLYMFFTLISLSAFGQTLPQFDVQEQNCIVGSDLALEEIAKGEPRLVMASGLVPVIKGGENAFEHEFGVSYHEFGCMPPSPMSCLANYNVEVFKYLDENYGSSWRDKVRDDLPGYKSYIMPFRNIFKGGKKF